MARVLSRGPRGADGQELIHHFIRDLDSSRFTRTGWWIATFVLAVGAAWVAAQLGVLVGLAITAGVTLALLVGAFVLEQQRWRAQDVIHWYQAARSAQWQADTGGPPPVPDDAAANEVWLGVHQPGTVPQACRVIAARCAGDPLVTAREIAALPDATPLDRANREYALAGSWNEALGHDLGTLRAEVAALNPGLDRTLFELYVAHVESLRRYRDGAADWLAPLAARWPLSPPMPLGRRRRFRILLSRVFPVVWFAIFGTIFVFGLSPAWAPSIPADYAKTEVSTRGDVPHEPSDWNQAWLTLPPIAAALPGATRSGDALSPDDWAQTIDSSVPTVIWDTHAISLAPPADAPGRRVAQLEILLGASTAEHGWVLVSFDSLDGPVYRYDLSPAAVRALQDVLGVVPAGG